MAPEIVFNHSYDYRIDIWSLGILLYELLHSHAPFKGRSYKDISKKLKSGDVFFDNNLELDFKNLIANIL